MPPDSDVQLTSAEANAAQPATGAPSASRRAVTRAHLIMAAILLLYGAVQVVWGEKTPFNGGTGYDGKIYSAIARDFETQVAGQQLRGYYVQRILPPAVAHYALRVTGQEVTIPSIIRTFEIMNVLCLLLAVLLWRSIGDTLGLSMRGRWLGFIGLFVNYFALRQTFYNPVMTDAFAFTLGLAMFDAFLKRRRVMLAILTILASFSWPVASYCGAALLVWPRHPLAEESDGQRDFSVWVGAGAAAVAAFLTWYIYFLNEKQWGLTVQELVIPSALLVLLYLFTAFRVLFRRVGLHTVRETLRSTAWPNVLLGVGVLIATKVVVSMVAAPTNAPPWAEAKQFLLMITTMPLQKPGAFLVAPIVYLGPIVILLIVHYGLLAAEIRRYGLGMMLAVSLTLLIALTGESRQMLLVYPWIVAMFVHVSERFGWPERVYWIVAGLSLVVSKVWMRINPQSPVYTFGEEWDFPRQRELMQYGPWMSPLTLAIQAAAIALIILMFHRMRLGPSRGSGALR